MASGGKPPPLYGAPSTVKGIGLADMPTTHGIKALVTAYPAIEASADAPMRAAGVILFVGK